MRTDELLKSNLELTKKAYDKGLKIREDSLGRVWSHSNSIYSGEILLLYLKLQLYLYSGEKTLIEDIDEKIKILIKRKSNIKRQNASVFHGRLGLSHLCMSIYEAVQDSKYFEISSILIKEYWLDSNKNKLDHYGLFDGVGGVLLHLLLIFKHRPEKRLLSLIEEHVHQFLDSIQSADNSIYFETNYKNNKGLTGLLYGTSGCGLILLLLFKIFRNECFKQLALMCFKHENDLLLETYRNSILLNKNIKERNKRDDFCKYNFSEGVAGLGLARLLAYEITGDSYFMADVQMALDVLEKIVYYDHDYDDNSFLNGFTGFGVFMGALSVHKTIKFDQQFAHRIIEKNFDNLAQNNSWDTSPKVHLHEVETHYFANQVHFGQGDLVLVKPIRELINTTWSDIQSEFCSISVEKILVKSRFPNTYDFIKKNNLVVLDWNNLEIETFTNSVNVSNLKVEFDFHLKLDQSINLVKNSIIDFDRLQKEEHRYLDFLSKEFNKHEAIDKLKLRLGNHVVLVSQDREVNLDTKMADEDLTDLFSNYGQLTAVTLVCPDNIIKTEILGIKKIIMDQFNSPNSLENVMSKIINFLKKQDKSLLLEIFEVSYDDLDDHVMRLSRIMLYTLVIEGVLVPIDWGGYSQECFRKL